MGYRKATIVRISGLEDAAQVDVLEAIATIANDADDSLRTVSVKHLLQLSRKSRPTFYKALSDLVSAGYVVCQRGEKSGDVSMYGVRLDRLPPPKVGFLSKMWEGLTQIKNLTDANSLPGQKVDLPQVKNLTDPQSKNLPTPGQIFDHKQENNKRRTREEQEVARATAPAPASDSLFPEDEPKDDLPKAAKKRRKPETPCPWEEGSAVPEDLRDWCRENCPTLDPQAEFDALVGHAYTYDRRCRDWKAAYRTWCNKSVLRQAQGAPRYAANRTSRYQDLRSLANGNQDEKDYDDLSPIYG